MDYHAQMLLVRFLLFGVPALLILIAAIRRARAKNKVKKLDKGESDGSTTITH